MGSRALQGLGQASPLGSSLVLQPVCTRLWPAASALSGGEQQVSLMQVGPIVKCWVCSAAPQAFFSSLHFASTTYPDP